MFQDEKAGDILSKLYLQSLDFVKVCPHTYDKKLSRWDSKVIIFFIAFRITGCLFRRI